MKKTATAFLFALAAGLAFTPLARAAGDEQRAAMKDKWESMTPEQKAAAKEKAKAKWDAKTPEEQAAAKKRFAENHPRAAARMAEKHKEGAASAPAK